MNDGQKSSPDLSKIVGLIMENPELIEEIANLAKKSEDEEALAKNSDLAVERTEKPEKEASGAPRDAKERRARLLCALKPYVSEGRAKAIDSMITISEMLEVMKAR